MDLRPFRRTSIPPANQAQAAAGARSAAASGDSESDQPGVVDGLHARQPRRRPAGQEQSCGFGDKNAWSVRAAALVFWSGRRTKSI